MDECASHVTLFSTQALSLELAGERRFATLAALAINPVHSQVSIVSLIFLFKEDAI